ncbi:MAG TPA: DUF6515 family protein [Bryobacteraceae bacterium]|nr:DUF6515 family protein [Bryobacteraceae bacterium]
MIKRGIYTLLFAVGLMSPMAIPNAQAFDRRDDIRDAEKERRKEIREARKELREDLRKADDREDVRDAYREYREEMREAEREYRNDVGEYGRPGYRGRSVPQGYGRSPYERDNGYRNRGYYGRESQGYAAVRPPAGAVVSSLPRGAQAVNVRGRRLYYYNGVHYQPIERYGRTSYVVVD